MGMQNSSTVYLQGGGVEIKISVSPIHTKNNMKQGLILFNYK